MTSPWSTVVVPRTPASIRVVTDVTLDHEDANEDIRAFVYPTEVLS